jgi:hypothetical protein
MKKSFEKRQDIDYADYTEITRPAVAGLMIEIQGFIEECASALEELLQQPGKTGNCK